MSKTISEKLVEIANNVPKVYEAGVTEGLSKGGYADGFEAGKQAEWDAFWDAFQYSGGTRSGYSYGFYGGGWNDITFKPKYTLKPSTATYMFRNSNITEIIDVDYKTNKCDTFFGTYRGCSKLVRVGDIYAKYATNLGEMFHGCSKLVSTGVITVKDTANFNVSFYDCEELVNITFDGTIGTDIAFTESTKLSADSIRSIIEHLVGKKDENDTEKKTLTLSRTAVETAIANGGFGGDTIFAKVDGEGYGFIPDCKIPLAPNERIKVTLEVEEGHHYTDFNHENANPNDWYVGLSAGAEPYYREMIVSGTDSSFVLPDGNLSVCIYLITGGNVSFNFKVRAVKIDADGNEIGENQYFVPNGSYSFANGTIYTIAAESWDTLAASKSDKWNISLV